MTTVPFYPEVIKTNDFGYELKMDCIFNECQEGTHEYFFSLNYSEFPLIEPTLVNVSVEVKKIETNENTE